MTLTELKEKAEAATPGPWKAYDWPGFPINDLSKGDSKCVRIESETKITAFCFTGDPSHDALFIAAANPQVVLALIACAEALETAQKYAIEKSLSEQRWDFLSGEIFRCALTQLTAVFGKGWL